MWSLYNLLGRWYCRTFHRSIMWAGSSHYRCARCSRIYRVPWADQQ